MNDLLTDYVNSINKSLSGGYMNKESTDATIREKGKVMTNEEIKKIEIDLAEQINAGVHTAEERSGMRVACVWVEKRGRGGQFYVRFTLESKNGEV